MNKIGFYSLVPHLTDFEGHQYIYHKSVEQALHGLDIEFQALIPNHSLITEWTKFFRGQKFRFFDFCKLFKNRKESSRIFFLESFNTSDLFSLFFASLLFSKKNDQIWLLLRYGPHQMQKSYHLLLKIFKKPKLLTDSELIAISFGKVLQRSIEVMPIPHTEEMCDQIPSDKIRCLWPGEPRETKGLKEIQNLAQNIDPAFTLLAAKHPSFENTKIDFIERGVDRGHYLKILQSSDILLLPYDPHVYKESTSGILVEAIIAGKWPLVKEGSWLAHELKKHHLSELIVDWSDPNFFAKVKEMIQSHEIKQKLNIMREKYTHHHSIKNFRKELHTKIFY